MTKATYALGVASLLIGATAPNDRISIPDDCSVVRIEQDGRENQKHGQKLWRQILGPIG
nr:hypothetical protein [uncultured Sphingosinicella sp.]